MSSFEALDDEDPEATEYEVDVLAFGPHPDDVEMGVGGTLCKLHDLGYSSAIVDMTEGEMGSYGNVEVRKQEAQEAADILGCDYRENMRLPDCDVEDTFENRRKAACLIRKYRPKIIFSPYYEGDPPGRGLGHNDHYKGGQVVSNAHNYAHLSELSCKYPPHYADAIFYYMLPRSIQPSFILDVTAYEEQWFDALTAHRSQFMSNDPEHNAAVKAYFKNIAKYWGSQIGAGLGQPYYSPTPLTVGDPMVFAEEELSLVQDAEELKGVKLETEDQDIYVESDD